MDIFPGWEQYVERLEKNWRSLVKEEDTVVIAGDISWAMVERCTIFGGSFNRFGCKLYMVCFRYGGADSG